MARMKKKTCPVCGRTFDTGQGYAAHTRAHKRNGVEASTVVVNQNFQPQPSIKLNGPTTLEILSAAREQLVAQTQALDVLIADIGGTTE